MVHFNELYITEDGKKLIIDTEVDDFPVYDKAYIEKITVNTVDNHCNGNTDAAVTVYSGFKNVFYVDLNDNHKIDEYDICWCEWLYDTIKKLNYTPEQLSKYDVNGDGVIDLQDVAAVLKYILLPDYEQAAFDPQTKQRYDVNNDGEVNIADINAIINAIRTAAMSSSSTLCEDDKLRLLDEDDEEGNTLSEGMLTKYRNRLQRDMSNGIGFYGEEERHVYSAVDKCDLMPIIGNQSRISGNLYLVKVTVNLNGNAADVACMGCGWDNNVIYGVAYDGLPMYKNFLDMAGQYSNACDNSNTEAMVDYILNYYGFDFALRMGDWCTALRYWKDLLNYASSGATSGRGCGCRGSR